MKKNTVQKCRQSNSSSSSSQGWSSTPATASSYAVERLSLCLWRRTLVILARWLSLLRTLIISTVRSCIAKAHRYARLSIACLDLSLSPHTVRKNLVLVLRNAQGHASFFTRNLGQSLLTRTPVCKSPSRKHADRYFVCHPNWYAHLSRDHFDSSRPHNPLKKKQYT